MNKQFEGIKNLFSENTFSKISEAHFCVIGIGGVGSWICESLIRSGATKLTIVDLDDLCFTNINRQIHALQTNVGKYKVDEMKARLQQINSEAQIICIYEFFTEKTKDTILNQRFDFVFDAIDSLKNKCLILDECRRKNIPVITIGASGGKTDPTKIEIKDLSKSINDSLLFRVRKSLRRDYSFSKFENKPFKIPCVFSTELSSKKTQAGLSNCQSGLGSASFVTASFAFAAVSYVLKSLHEQEI